MIGFGFRSYLPLKLGQVVATTLALSALKDNRLAAVSYLIRHSSGDWGEVDADDAELNHQALKSGGRVLSAYELRDGQRILIVTEADRSVTTIFVASERESATEDQSTGR